MLTGVSFLLNDISLYYRGEELRKSFCPKNPAGSVGPSLHFSKASRHSIIHTRMNVILFQCRKSVTPCEASRCSKYSAITQNILISSEIYILTNYPFQFSGIMDLIIHLQSKTSLF